MPEPRAFTTRPVYMGAHAVVAAGSHQHVILHGSFEALLGDFNLVSSGRNQVKPEETGIIAGRRGPDDHAGCIHAMTGNAVGGTGVAAKCSEIGDAVAQLRFSSGENDDNEEYRCKTDLVSRFHGEMNAL